MGFRFEQLAGDKTVLELEGYAAPFGRPRQKPVMTEIIDCTVATTIYPGSRGSPTRHVFSSHWEPMELSGRWMTRYLPGVDADLYARSWTRFVRDQQPVRIAWGNLASWKGFIQRLELARESPNDIAWKMTVLIDQREGETIAWSFRPSPTILPNLGQITDIAISLNAKFQPLAPDFAPDFLDTLEALVLELRGATKILNDWAFQFENITKRAFSVVQGFLGAIKNVESLFAELRLFVLNTQIDAALFVQRATSTINYWAFQNDLDVKTLAGLAMLKDLERKAALTESRGDNRDERFIQARNHDTWEQIAFRAGLGIDGASSLRDANGIHYGDLPQAGELYVVP